MDTTMAEFTAKFPGTCKACTVHFNAGEKVSRWVSGGYAHFPVCPPVEGFGTRDRKDALVEAVIASEVAEDLYNADQYWWSTINVDRQLGFGSRYWRAHDRSQQLLRDKIDAGTRMMLEADAYGLIDLNDATDEGLQRTVRFALGQPLDGTCRDEVYRHNNGGATCPCPVYKDGRCEDHYWKLEEARAEAEAEQAAELANEMYWEERWDLGNYAY